MRILFTGGSSFTGMWFIQELKKRGHEVVALIRKPFETYEGVRKKRIEEIQEKVDLRFGIEYGSHEFLNLIEQESFDLFCHHAADVTNYKSPDFDPISALGNNVGPLRTVLKTLKKNGCSKVLLTGSIFSQNEGAGSDHLKAVSPYGLSKGLTSAVFEYYCEEEGVNLGQFIIPNPFGPFEEFRFTSFLIQNWFEEKNVVVSMPSYVRDNIHVSLLAKAYANFSEQFLNNKIHPSGYPESQGAFTARFANAMRKRLNLPCEYTLIEQTQFSEPKVRLNTDLLDAKALGWNEEIAWDDLAEYYKGVFSGAQI